MIGKHVVIDTLDNFKAKLSLIPSSAIVLIKDVGQIYAHGTYFGAQKTYSLLTKTADGLAPKGGTSASSLIEDGESEWVLTVTNGENPSWRRLPANAFNSSSYTLSSATTSDLGGIKVGQVYTATFDDLVGQYYKINVDKNGLAYVNVPWVNTVFTASGNGITMKDNVFSLSLNSTSKLDSAIGNKIYAVSLDKNGKLCVSVPWVDTNNIFVGATETKNGSSGMVPAPIANQHRYFLRGDGTWVKPNLSDLNDDVVNGKYLPKASPVYTGILSTKEPGLYQEAETLFFRNASNTADYGTQIVNNWNDGSSKTTRFVLDKTGVYFKDVKGSSKTIYHSGNFNPSDYLSKSGGKIKGVLKINGDDKYNTPLVIETPSMGDWGFIQFHNGAKVLGHIGVAGVDTPVFRSASGTNNTLIHSGNIGSQSVSYANSAGMLSACSLSDANTATYTDTSLRWFSMIPSTVLNLPTVTGWQNGLLAFPLHSNGVTAQLYFSATKKIYYRSIAGSDYDWNEIAYVTDNVASANYAATARDVMINYTGLNTNYEVVLTNPRDYGSYGMDALYHSHSKTITFNPSTGVLSADTFSGNATNADKVDGFHMRQWFTNASDITNTAIFWQASGNCSDVSSMGYAALINVIGDTGRRWQIWNSRNNHQLFWRPEKSDMSDWADVHVLLDNYNFKDYVANMYWANVPVSSTSNDKTTPTFANTTVNGIVTVNGPQCAITVNSSCKGAYADFIRMLNPNMSSTYHTAHLAFGYALSAYNLGYIGFKFVEKDSKSNMVTIGLHSADHILNVLANGNVGIGTTSPSYKLHVAGDIYTSGWSRADNGFYVEGKGVHYMSNNANGIGQIYLSNNNEFNWSASAATLYFNYRASANGTTVTSYVWNAGSYSSYASHSLGNLYIKTATLSTTLPTYDNAPLKFNATANNNDSSNSRYQPWISGKDSVNSYGYGVTVSTGIYRDPGYSSGGYYIGCGWDGNANSVMWKFSRNGYLYGNFSGYLNGTAYSADAIKDSNNGTRITACYSTGGFSSNPSWLAAWNGYHLTYVSPGVLSVNYANSAGNADTVDNLHASDFVRAYGTFGTSYSYDSDWGLSIVTFDPVVSGTAPAQNPNISILNIGNNYARRKQLAFTYSTNDIYYRRRIDSSWSGWVRLAISGESYTKTEADSRFINAAGDTMTGTLYLGDTSHYLQYYKNGKYVELYNGTAATGIGVWDNGKAQVFNSSGLYKIWHEGNDGSGSGLNADLLDGYHEYSFLRYRDLGSNGGATLWSQIGIRSYHGALPEGLSGIYSYGEVVSLPGNGSRLDIFTNHVGSSESGGLGGLWWRSGWNDDKKTWRRIIDSGNIGSQSVSYASSAGNANTVDNYHISVTSSAGTNTSTIYFVT